MKSKKPFQIPLVPRAIEIATYLAAQTNGSWLFPSSQSQSGHITDAAMMKVYSAKLGYDPKEVSNHGARSSFRTWARDNLKNSDIAELCLDHVTGSKVEQAYKRGHAIEPRRKMLEEWGEFILSEVDSDV